jgi:hypothetical protein
MPLRTVVGKLFVIEGRLVHFPAARALLAAAVA